MATIPAGRQPRAVSFGAAATGGEEISLDPVPQVLSARIECALHGHGQRPAGAVTSPLTFGLSAAVRARSTRSSVW